MAHIYDRVSDYSLGNTETLDTTAPGALDLYIESACVEMMRALPPALTFPLSGAGTATSSSAVDSLAADVVVLAAFHTSGGKQCSLVSNAEFNRASNAGSAYEATTLAPIYTIENGTSNTQKVSILPDTGSNGVVFTFDAGTINSTASMPATIPVIAHEAIIIGVALKVLSWTLSEHIFQEDPELTNMVQSQIQHLEKMYQLEMSKIFGGKE